MANNSSDDKFQERVLDFIEKATEQLGGISAHVAAQSAKQTQLENDVVELNKQVNRAHGAVAVVGGIGAVVTILKALRFL